MATTTGPLLPTSRELMRDHQRRLLLWVAASLAVVYAFTVPLETLSVMPGVGVSDALLPGVCLLLVLPVLIAADGRVRFGRQGFLILALCLWAVASFYWSGHEDNTAAWLEGFLGAVLLGTAAGAVIPSRTWLRRLMAGYVAGAAVAACTAILQGVSGNYAIAQDSRASAFGQDPNAMAVTIAAAVPFAVLLATTARPRWRVLPAGAIAIDLLGVLSTGSRTGLIALGLGLGLSIVLQFRMNLGRASIVVLATWFAVRYLLPNVISAATLHRLNLSSGLLLQGDFNGRQEIWRAALPLVDERWLAGWGAGEFPNVVSRSYGHSIASHNMFISLAVELGCIGVTLFVIALAGTALPLVRSWRVPEASAVGVALLIWGCGAMTLTFTAEKITWLLLGVAVAAVRLTSSASRNSGSRTSLSRTSGSRTSGSPTSASV